MKQEIWKLVNGYEGYYEVSNLGKVKSCAKCWTYGKKKESILKPSYVDGHYDSVTFCVDGIKKYRTVHKLVAEHFCDNPNNYPVVNHLDSDIYNNMASNLEWTTSSGNSIHGYEHGRRIGMKGEKHGMRKITESQAKELINRRNKGETITELSKYFNISIAQASRIANGKRWAHI
jgi:NUMOD4 motif-containing protein